MKVSAWAAAIIVAVLLVMASTYVVREGETAMVLKLGRVDRAGMDPGLHFKWPFIESALVFDQRLQVIDADAERYLTSERKDVLVDFFAVGKIADIGAFYRATGGDESIAVARLAPIIKDSLRNAINSRTLKEVVSGDRSEIIDSQLATINKGAQTVGVEIVDLRIKKIDLPSDSQVITDVYRRMRAQRHEVASRLRAEGAEQAQTVRAKADKQREVILAEAESDAQRLRGEGDATSARIYAEAAQKNPAFYAFQRSLQAYRKAFDDSQSVIVLDDDDPFLQYLEDDNG